MKAKAAIIALSVCILILGNVTTIRAQKSISSDEMWKLMTQLNPNFKQYFWTVYPTGIWGLGTVMRGVKDDKKGDKIFKNPSYQVMPNWNFFGITKQPSTAQEMATFAGVVQSYSYLDDTPGIPEQKMKLFRQRVLEFSLPSIKKLIGISANLDSTKDVTTVVSFAKLETRQLDTTKIKEYVEELQAKLNTNPSSLTSYQKRVLDLKRQKKLFLITRDVLISGITLSVKYTGKLTNKEDISLVETLNQYVGKDAKLSFAITKSNEGEYKIVINEPFVFARYGHNYEEDVFN